MPDHELNKELNKKSEELKSAKDLVENKNKEIALLNDKLRGYEKTIDGLRNVNNKVFSILSHDLRSPFNGLLGFTNFLSRDIETFTNDQIKMFADGITISARALLELIDDLFNWAKLERGDTTYKPMDVELNYIISEIFYLIKAHSDSKEIKLFNNIPKNTFVFADLYMIKTVLQNLIYNAVKFTSNGGEIKVDAGKDTEDSIVILIEDNGVGIQKQYLKNLFKANSFFTTRGTANEKGSGLGLVLCKELLKRNNGKISVESEPGKGTSFFITLPRGKNNGSN
jgi:signal transduction histidine kinase